MPSTYTTRLRLEKPANGEQAGTWGVTANTDYDLLDQGIAGVVAVTHDNAANYTLTALSGSADEARNMALVIGGTLTANRNVIIPSVQKVYLIRNATSGGFSITIKTAGGIGLTIPNGFNQWCYCDSVNVYEGTPAYNPTTGSFVGNVSTADKWTTARTLTVTGDASGSVSFDGSANASLAITIAGLAEAGVQSVSLAGTTPRSGAVSITEADTVNILLGGNVVRLFNGRTGNVTLTSADVTSALGFTPVQSFNTRSGNITLLAADVTTALGATAVQNATNATNAVNLTGTITGDKVTSAVANATNAANATLAATATTANQLKGKAVATPSNPADNGKFLQYVSASDSFILATPATSGGSVTSVALSGGTTGLTVTGSPITTSGTITLGGTVAVASGGTNITSYATGDLLYASSSSALSKLGGNTSTTRNFLASTGTGSAAQAPAWAALASTDIPNLSTDKLTSGTLPTTRGGTGLTSFTSGKAVYSSSTSALTTGDLPVTAGGTGTSTAPSQGGIIYAGSTSAYASTAAGTNTQLLRSNGTAAPTWVTPDLTYLPTARFKQPVRVATTVNITLSGTQTIDGVSAIAGDRVLVKDQTVATANGIYVVAAGAWSRATDADAGDEISLATIPVGEGTVNGGTLWRTNFKPTDVIGGADIKWYQVIASGLNASFRIGQNSTDAPGVSNTTTGGCWEYNADGTTLHISRSAYAGVRLNVNTDDNLADFFRSGTNVGSISVTTTATAYNTSSDYRLKEDLEPVSGAVASVLATPVYRFRWKATPEAPKVYGFMAHEAQATVPEAVTGAKDGPQMQAIDQSKLVPLLWAAVQELAGRVAALEAAQAP